MPGLMALTKRGRYWHYDFIYRGQRMQGSTEQTNINKARLALAAIRSNAALEHLGVAPPKVSPLFKDFMERFLAHVRQHAKKPRTVEFYEARTARLLDYFADYRLSDIDEDLISKYKSNRGAAPKRLGKGPLSDGTINRELATLRKALGLAYEWHLIARLPKVRLLPGEKGRDYVLTGEMETLYLTKIEYPLKQVAILMLDLGLRPEECMSVRKEDLTSEKSEKCIYTSIHIRHGKTANAVRSLPLTERASSQIEFLNALWPDSEFLFPGKKGKHMVRAHLDHLHQAARQENGWPNEFVLYSCRHTFGTRLAESGASPFEIKKAMGHSSIKVSEKYIHLSADHLTLSLKRKEAYDRLLRGEVDPAISHDSEKVKP